MRLYAGTAGSRSRQKLTKSPVHEFAEAHGILVRTPKTLRSAEAQAELKALQADISVVAAYGLILPQAVIEAFPLGCINIHGSLLPRWRGAAPIQRAIEAGDNESGITIMKVVEKLDAGDMLLKGSVPITAETTGETLHDAMAGLGAELIVKALDNWQNLHAEPQDERLVTYAAKIDKSESRLDFRCRQRFWSVKYGLLIRIRRFILNTVVNVIRFCVLK